MDLHGAMTVFAAVANNASFAAAARRLNISASAVSRHVADLEQELGVTLLRRSTRHVSLTDAGCQYLARATAILDEIETLHDEMGSIDTVPRGKLRITAPPVIGNDWIAPLAVDFIEAYPEISLELDLTERVVDLVAEGFDAAIRSGTLPSSSLIARTIIAVHYVICASPGYLADKGTPERPEDLAHHECIQWYGGSNGPSWLLRSGEGHANVPIKTRLMVSNVAAQREAVVRSLGIALLPARDVRDDIAAGRLVAVMPDYTPEPFTLSLVRPATPFEPPRLRAFIDFITDALRRRAVTEGGA